MLKYSAKGPNTSEGKNASAAIIIITASVINPNVPVSVLNVPADSGIYFFFDITPAIATGAIIGMNLENNNITPVVTFQKTLLAVKPLIADPLLAATDVF